ncbi:hypothetical protein PFFCH_00571 [Plasmodium falciparum FCH/4]|uniref:Uncharacterized protein n=1 Tax=Plasmodium falciparum FCH/4 TaxID=1036724 RepID=A0A024VUK5_PLAFA|nr:hypothetical protein PFFCH_00571 [Plasmodium falciparum FCH/4]
MNVSYICINKSRSVSFWFHICFFDYDILHNFYLLYYIIKEKIKKRF